MMDFNPSVDQQSHSETDTVNLVGHHLQPCAQTALILWQPPVSSSSDVSDTSSTLTIVLYNRIHTQAHSRRLTLNPIFEHFLNHISTLPRIFPYPDTTTETVTDQEGPLVGIEGSIKLYQLTQELETPLAHQDSLEKEGEQHILQSSTSYGSLASFCTQPRIEQEVVKMSQASSPAQEALHLLPPFSNEVIEMYNTSLKKENQVNLFSRRLSDHVTSSPSIMPSSASHTVHNAPPTHYTPLQQNTVYPSPQPTRVSRGVASVHTPNSPYFIPPPIRVSSAESSASSHSSNTHKCNPKDADEDEDAAKMDQWKVGKRPGHQGSFVKQSESEEDGGKRKRTLNESIHISAERVLKKPFRAPKLISKNTTASKGPTPPAQSSPASRTPTHGSPRSKSLCKSVQITDNMRKEKKILAKPFKTPTRVNNQFTPPNTIDRARGPSSKPSKSIKPGLGNRPRIILHKGKPKEEDDKTRIDKLEKRERTLREALKYMNDPEEEERIAESTEKWLSVGRIIVGRLFELAPHPDGVSSTGSKLEGQGGFASGWGFDSTFGYGSETRSSYLPTMEFTPLSEAQKEFLKTVDRNEDGDPIDAEGNLLMGEMGSGDYGAAFRENDNWGTNSGYDQAPTYISNQERADPPAWNPAMMLMQMGVDSGTLGWNEELEDWE